MQKLVLILSIVVLLTAFSVYADTGIGESASGFLTSLPPAAPILNNPENDMTNVPETIIIKWYSLPHAATYNLQVSNAAIFNDFIVNESAITDTSFTVNGLDSGTSFYWRVCAINVAGAGDFSPVWHFTTTASTLVSQTSKVPQRYALLPVYPNPFNPVATVTYHLPEQAEVSLIVFNSMGRSVRELDSGLHQAGRFTVQWDGRDSHGAPVTSGVYMCRFEAGSRVFIQKMLLMR